MNIEKSCGICGSFGPFDIIATISSFCLGLSFPGRGSSTRIWTTYSAAGIRNSGRNHKRSSKTARRLDPRLIDALQEQPAKQTGEHPDGQKESGWAGNPRGAVWRESPAGDNTV